MFYVDDLLVIQVGTPDESPKYIAYRDVSTNLAENQFNAKVLEIYDDYIMVEALKGQDIVGEVRVQLGLISRNDMPKLKKNDTVRITHDGKMTMSLPPQMIALDITLIK